MANIEPRGENSYRFTVSLGKGADGKYKRCRKTISVEGKYTPKRLREYLEHEYLKFKQEVESGEYIAPEKMLFSQFAAEWESKFAEQELSETAIGNHLSRLNNHILPVIGHMRMDQIKALHLTGLLKELKRQDGTDKPLSITTRQDVYKTLKSIFKYAKKWESIKVDPMDGVDKPKGKDEITEDANVYDEAEVAALLEAVQDEPFHWRIFLTLALTAGLRRSENLGLEWSKVDLEKGTVDIIQVIVKGRKGPVIKQTKSKKSKRLIALPASVVEEMKNYQLHWNNERLKMGDKWIEKEHEWLFSNENGTHLYPTTPTTWWKRFTKRIGVRHIRLHDLRHTSATLLIAQGVHVKIISERLGHSDIRITMDIYGHALRSADQAAANTFEHLFQPQKNKNAQ